MLRHDSRSALMVLAGLVLGVVLTGCGEGEKKTGTPKEVENPTTAVFAPNECISTTINFVSTSQWWVSGSIDVSNKCDTEQNLSSQTVKFTSQDSNGTFVEFPTLTSNDSGTNHTLTLSKTNGNTVSGNFDSSLVIKAKQTLSFTGGLTLNGFTFNSTLATSSAVLNGTTPTPTPTPVVQYGSLEVVVDTANAGCSTGTNCSSLGVIVTDDLGKTVSSFTVPSQSIGATFTQSFSNLKAGATYNISSTLLEGTTQTFEPNANATIVANTKSVVAVNYVKKDLGAQTGKVEITLPSLVPNFTDFVQVQILNSKNNGSVVANYSMKQGTTITSTELPVSDATHEYQIKLSTGIADPKNGLYFSQQTMPIATLQKGATTSLTVPLTKTATLHDITLTIGALKTGDTSTVSFSDASGKYSYVSYPSQGSSTVVYKGEANLNMGLSVQAATGNYEINPIVNTGVISSSKVYSAVFKEPVVNTNATYDYIAPFKDYNNKIILSVQGLSSAKSVTFTSNFQQKDGWGTCFGQSVDNLTFSTVASGKRFTTTITPKSSAVSLNLTQSCEIMGTDSGEAIVLPGVVDPIVYNVVADNQTLAIKQPCSGNGCKDPGNGYRVVGYYAQWAVWGRQYNPYDIPFGNINGINYAFVGFNPADGTVKTLDASADSWGMSAISRAMLQYPYLKTYLSFGGWTNNGVNTAPMFEQLASSTTSMNTFATQAVALMRKTGYSGIDIDWEWWSDYDKSVAPAKKMLALYKILRVELDKAGVQDGKSYALTIAVNGGVDNITPMQSGSNPNSVSDFWAQVGKNVNYVNVMNYDYHGSWDKGAPAYFQAMYDFFDIGSYKVGKDEGWSIKDSINSYIANGVNSKQLVVGVPLYARTMSVDSDVNGGLFQNVTGAGFGDYEDGILDYKCIINPVNDPKTGCGSDKPVASIKGLTFYDSTRNTTLFNQYGKNAMQPWAFNASSKQFMTYDDTVSATAKAKDVKTRQLGGAMFWELDGDTLDPSTSIVQAVKNEFNK